MKLLTFMEALRRAWSASSLFHKIITILHFCSSQDIYSTIDEWDRSRSLRHKQLYANCPAKSPKPTPRNSCEDDTGNDYAEPRETGKPHPKPPKLEASSSDCYTKPSSTEGSQANGQERRSYTELTKNETSDAKGYSTAYALQVGFSN